MAPGTFNELLTRQVGHEFAASHQYIAVAVWSDSQDLPQLARHFHRQSLEERKRAMMIVQYILDRDLPPTIPGAGEVRNDFADVIEPLTLALSQEQEITEQIKAWIPAVVATPAVQMGSSRSRSRSVGVAQARDFRGRGDCRTHR